MPEPTPPKKSTRKTRHKKTRRHVWFEATVQNDHVHVQASAPTKWFRVLRWVILIIAIRWLVRALKGLFRGAGQELVAPSKKLNAA